MPELNRSKLAELLKSEEQLFHENYPKSYELHQRARKSLHGGVSMLWMIRWAGSFPVFVREAKGARFTDVDGNPYIDFYLGDTSALTGHSPDATVLAISEQIQKGITLMLPYEDVIWFVSQSTATSSYPREISVADAVAKRDAGAFILDVRQPEEWDEFHVPDSTLIPLDQLAARMNELPKEREIVIVCRSGNRSAQGRDMLLNAGFTQVTSMAGGLTQWKAAGNPTVSGP